MREVREPGLIENLSPFLEEAKTHALVIRDGDTELGAIVSMEDYEIVRKAKIEKFLRLSDELGEQIRTRGAVDGLSPEDLMKLLDRKASYGRSRYQRDRLQSDSAEVLRTISHLLGEACVSIPCPLTLRA